MLAYPGCPGTLAVKSVLYMLKYCKNL